MFQRQDIRTSVEKQPCRVVWKTRITLYRGYIMDISAFAHAIFFRHDVRHPIRHPSFIRDRRLLVKYWPFNAGGRMRAYALSVFLVLHFSVSWHEHIEIASRGKKWDFVTDRNSHRMQKNSKGSEIPFSEPGFFPLYSDVRHDGDIIVFAAALDIGEICSGDSADDTSLITAEQTALQAKMM